jgi:hypothetical protein
MVGKDGDRSFIDDFVTKLIYHGEQSDYRVNSLKIKYFLCALCALCGEKETFYETIIH